MDFGRSQIFQTWNIESSFFKFYLVCVKYIGRYSVNQVSRLPSIISPSVGLIGDMFFFEVGNLKQSWFSTTCDNHFGPMWLSIFGHTFSKNVDMPLFEEFCQTSQETSESESDSNVSWDVCQNSSKSGMSKFFKHIWPNILSHMGPKWLSQVVGNHDCFKMSTSTKTHLPNQTNAWGNDWG